VGEIILSNEGTELFDNWRHAEARRVSMEADLRAQAHSVDERGVKFAQFITPKDMKAGDKITVPLLNQFVEITKVSEVNYHVEWRGGKVGFSRKG
jgi:hypothetical protein